MDAHQLLHVLYTLHFSREGIVVLVNVDICEPRNKVGFFILELGQKVLNFL